MKPKEERKGEKTPNSHTPDEVFDRPILQRSPCHHHSRQHCGKKEQHRHSRQQTSNPFPLFLHTPQRGKRRANRNMKKVQEDQSTNKTSPQTAVVPPLCFHFFLIYTEPQHNTYPTKNAIRYSKPPLQVLASFCVHRHCRRILPCVKSHCTAFSFFMLKCPPCTALTHCGEFIHRVPVTVDA